MGRGLVFSANFGGRSSFLPVGVVEDGVDYLMFTDAPSKAKGLGWKVVGCERAKDKDYRLESRRYKWPLERLPMGYDWVLWIDSTHNIAVPLRELVEGVWLKDHTIAAFPHPLRQCSIKEVDACLRRGKDSPKKLEKAKAFLKAMKFPSNAGLFALGVVARKVCPEQAEMGKDLLRKLVQYTARDQIFFMHALMRCGLKCHAIEPGSVYKSEFFNYHGPHG